MPTALKIGHIADNHKNNKIRLAEIPASEFCSAPKKNQILYKTGVATIELSPPPALTLSTTCCAVKALLVSKYPAT